MSIRDIIILNPILTILGTDHANRINNQEFAAYGDKAYLYIPNSEDEHVFGLSLRYHSERLLLDRIYKNPRYIITLLSRKGWTDVKGNLIPDSSSTGTHDYISTIPS